VDSATFPERPPREAAGGSRCRLCGSASVVGWREKRGFPIARCAVCGNAFVPDAAVPPDVESLYGPAYFAGEAETGYPTYLRDAPVLERNFALRLAWLESQRAPGRLLDVGAAYGLCLKVARERGWRAMGVEISPACAAAAERLAGVPVAAGDFLAVDLPGPFDVITMFDVLEHFRDPGACVARALDLLAPGGALVIETGDLASPWARLLGRAWYFLDPPQHLSYFTAPGLARFLARRGFAPDVRLRRPGRWVSLANVAFKLAHHAPSAALRAVAGRVARSSPRGALYLNFGDGMLVVARRPAASR
jgi:SAM-dependent methyltransferase